MQSLYCDNAMSLLNMRLEGSIRISASQSQEFLTHEDDEVYTYDLIFRMYFDGYGAHNNTSKDVDGANEVISNLLSVVLYLLFRRDVFSSPDPKELVLSHDMTCGPQTDVDTPG